MSTSVSWLLELTVNDGQLDTFKALSEEMIAATQANEPGTLAYEWALSDDGATCHVYERYADSDATLVHLGSFGANYAERFLACLTPTRFVVYGSPDARVKDALAGFNPTYIGPLGGFTR